MKKFTTYFTTIECKATKEIFTRITDDAPENLQKLIRSIENDFDSTSSEWINLTIREAFEEMEDGIKDKDKDKAETDLYLWFGESYAKKFCDEVMESPHCPDIYEIISEAQKNARKIIYNAVNDFLN